MLFCVGNKYVGLIERLNDKVMSDKSTILAEVYMRSKKHIHIHVRAVATLYGERSRDERVCFCFTLRIYFRVGSEHAKLSTEFTRW